MQLETERLLLRAWQADDVHELFRNARDPRIGLAAGWSPHKTMEDSLFVLQTVFSAPEVYAIVLKSTGLPIGCIGLMQNADANMPLEDDEREIGYWIGVPYWGKGITAEAVERLLEHAFLDLHCRAIWCSYYAENHQSARVAEKCGFVWQRMQDSVETPLGDIRAVHYTCLTREKYTYRNAAIVQ